MTICSCMKPNTKSVENGKASQIKGKVWLMKKNFLKITDVGASLLDRVYELLGNRVSIQLISSDRPDPANGPREKLGRPSHLEKWVSTITPVKAGLAKFKVTFDWDESMGVPAAFIIRNNHHSQFYLKTVTLKVPGHGQVHFVCNSWVYPAHRYKYNRVFFCNKTYLPCRTPGPLKKYREEELINLRGNGGGMLKEWDRVYDYDVYNDLGKPEGGKEHARPVLGGSQEYPYPRRGRTGRKRNKKDPKNESRLPAALSLKIYVPRDERFSHLKFTEFLGHGLRTLLQISIPMIKCICLKPCNKYDSLEDVYNLYQDDFKLPNDSVSDIRGVLVSKGHKLPVPDVIKVDRSAWMTDEEFGREMLAGVNPVIISRLQEFPPTSKLDSTKYGNQNSTITKEHIEVNMNGLTVNQAIDSNRLFILDHHDALMPYLKKINSTTTKTYASRTILLLQDDGTLKPLAIELSLPHPQGQKYGAASTVFTPAKDGVEESVWQLAKAYVAVNDSGYHQLISHWLNTHAVIEPFVIASNRQLSVLHPIYKLLQPHFRDTMNINALARQILINADGILERTVFPAKYAMEMSSFVYKNWNFTEQGLPADLQKRGVAVPDSSKKHGLRLLIEDYPYAVDGLEIWSAIETWVKEYCAFYYPTDELIQQDHELQEWWTEIRTKGHGDKKDEPWWPKMQSLSDLTESCTVIIWIASALHAAVNFGQYPYAGYLPNRPTVSRRFMPEQGTPEYAELEKNHDLAFLRTITAQCQTLLGVSLIEILSIHAKEEVYLGQRESDWTSDSEPLEAFKKFGETLKGIEKRIMEMNDDKRLKNRVGPVRMPYTWLIPNTADHPIKGGITNKGVPNSISI